MKTEELSQFLELDRKSRGKLYLNQLSKKTALFAGGLLVLWAISLLYLLWTDWGMPNPSLRNPTWFFVLGMLVFGVGMIYNGFMTPNWVKRTYDPRDRAKRLLIITLFQAPFMLGFSILGILAFLPTIIGSLIFGLFFLLFCWIIYKNIEEVINLYRIFSKYGASRILQNIAQPKIGDTVTINFKNESEALKSLELTATMRNISERVQAKIPPKHMQARTKKKQSTELKTFVRREETQMFVHDSASNSLEFHLNPIATLPTRFGAEPDYWELEFSKPNTDFYARFILDVQR